MKCIVFPSMLILAGCSADAQSYSQPFDNWTNTTDLVPVENVGEFYENEAFEANSAIYEPTENITTDTMVANSDAGTLFAPPWTPPAPSRCDELCAMLKGVEKTPRALNSGDILYKGLKRFIGKSPQYAFKTLGYPDKQMFIAGVTVYSWENITGGYGGGQLRCTVKVIVRGKLISDTDFYGNGGACARFARLIDPSFSGSN